MINSRELAQVALVLKQGGVIAYPTESVFGLGCDPNNLSALQKILDIKQRPAHKGLIILVSEINQALDYLQPLSQAQLDRLHQKSPRATTWLIPKAPELPELLCGTHQRLAVRITQHPVAKAICQYTNSPLVSTSCNLQGEPEMTQYSEVNAHFSDQLDMLVTGTCSGQKPSQIIDLITNQIIRQ